MNNELISNEKSIQNKIYFIRGVQVMLDKDLAELYEVLTGNLNKAVKRNRQRFSPGFFFFIKKKKKKKNKKKN